MSRLAGKTALITGASKGIGKATAELFVKHGAKVIITDILEQEGTKLVAKLGKSAEFFQLDVQNEAQWQKLFNHIQQNYPTLDIAFNNAGILGVGKDFGPQDPENASLSSWHTVHNINLDGVFLGCKYAIKLMKTQKDGGSIINMSSRSGVVGVPNTAAYASSKAAIRNHTKTVALYCAQNKYNIRCNSVHPACILTDIWDPMLKDKSQTKQVMINKLAASIPLGHMGEPLDVAYAVLYLASDEAKFITGSELTIDGGILAGSSASPSKQQ